MTLKHGSNRSGQHFDLIVNAACFLSCVTTEQSIIIYFKLLSTINDVK